MRTILFWTFGFFTFSLCLGSVVSLISGPEEEPTRVKAGEFRTSGITAKWVQIDDAVYHWFHGIRGWTARKRDSSEQRDVMFYIPVVPAQGLSQASFDKLNPEDLVVLARFDEKTAEREFGITRASTGPPEPDVGPCMGVRRPFDVIDAETRAKLIQEYPGIEAVQVLDLGKKPARTSEVRTMLGVGAVFAFLWLFWRRRRRRRSPRTPGVSPEQISPLLEPAFSMLGKLSKADGRVSAEEIQAVKTFMEVNGMDEPTRQAVIAIFNRAKDDGRDIRVHARKLASLDPDREQRRRFFGVLFSVACADGKLHDAERKVLQGLVEPLALSPDAFDAMHTEFFGPTMPLGKCYETLGCSEDATDEELQRAYHEKMRKFHPDKIRSKDLPEEFHEYAKSQTQQLQAAYETIRTSRGR